MEMTAKKKLGLLFSFIILLIMLFVGYVCIHYVYQESVLKKEINNLTTLDITKDKFNLDTVTYGDYKVVEESIKNYLNDYADNLQNINKIVSDEKFKQLLSYDNLSQDEDYKKPINYVDNIKVEFNTYMDNLIVMCDEENIKNNILSYHLNSYYVDLYNDLMFNDEVINKLNLSKDYLENYRENINVKLNTCLEIFVFLNNNKENYKFEDGEIKFSTQELIDQYNGYIQKINN